MTCSDAARAAIALVQQGWTTIEPAVDVNDKRCPSWRSDAVAWTLLGSISGARGVTDKDRLQLIGKLAAITRRADPHALNTTRQDVLALLERCIEDKV